MSNFHLEKYLGKWYEVGKYPNPWENNCPLAQAEYTWLPQKGKMLVVNSCYDNNNNKLRESVGLAKPTKIPNLLKVKFSENPIEGDYYVHWTDYDNFSIVGDNKDGKGNFLWLLSRTPTISAETAIFLLDKVKKYGYNPEKIITNPSIIRKY